MNKRYEEVTYLDKGSVDGAGNSVARSMEKIVHSITKGLMWFASGLLVLVVLFTVSHDAARYLFNAPIRGFVELTELAFVLIIFFAMVYATFVGEHISAPILVSRFPRRAQEILTSIMTFIGVVVFAFVSWQLGRGALNWMHLGRVGQSLPIPLFPFKLGAAIGAGLISLELLISFFHSLGRRK